MEYPYFRTVRASSEAVAESTRLLTGFSQKVTGFDEKKMSAMVTLLEAHFRRAPVDIPLRILDMGSFTKLEPLQSNECYWCELDHIVEYVRFTVFYLLRARSAALLSVELDAVARALQLRHLIELAEWAVFYQTGVSIAFKQLADNLDALAGTLVTSPDIENFVRGAISPSPARYDAANAAIGASVVQPFGDEVVDELSATVRKQGEVTRYIASETAARLGLAGLVEHCDRLDHAYYYLCGIAHASPVLIRILGSKKEASDAVRIQYELTVQVLTSTHTLLNELFFHPRYDGTRFWPLLKSVVSGTPRAIVELGVDVLKQLGRLDDAVTIKFDDGRILNLYRGAKKRP